MTVTRAELCLCGLLCDKDFAVLGGGVRFFSAIKSCGDSRPTSSASLRSAPSPRVEGFAATAYRPLFCTAFRREFRAFLQLTEHSTACTLKLNYRL